MRELTISVLVVVLDDDSKLENCLERLEWADEIVVVFNYVTDQSTAIVDKYNGRMIQLSEENEGLIRNAGIEACVGNWILEIDVHSMVTNELAKEISETILNSNSNVYTLNIDNYICEKLITLGWVGSPIGKHNYIGLYKPGFKTWGPQRTNPVEITRVAGISGHLKNSIINKRFKKISNMLGLLDKHTTLRAKDLAENFDTTSLLGSFLNFLYSFMIAYLARKSYKEGAYGFMLALCSGLYPLISNIKAIYEERDKTE